MQAENDDDLDYYYYYYFWFIIECNGSPQAKLQQTYILKNIQIHFTIKGLHI